MIKFQYPVVLLIIPVLIFLFILKLKRKNVSGVGFSELKLLKKASGGSYLYNTTYFIRGAAILSLIIAFANPVKENAIKNNDASGVDIIMAIDVSGSMDALDFSTKTKKQNRLEAVKTVVKEFIDSRPMDRIGVVAFGGAPYVASPLTLDHDWLYKRMGLLKTGMIEGGTAIGSAIVSAANRLDKIDSKSKIIIVLTDGENNSGTIEPIQAAEVAAALGIKIYTVGAGSEGQAPYEVQGFFQKEIQYMDVNIDEDMLTKVAESTGGSYFRAKDLKSLENIYDQINNMEKTKRVSSKSITYKEFFFIPLIIGFILLLIEIILSSTKLRRVF